MAQTVRAGAGTGAWTANRTSAAGAGTAAWTANRTNAAGALRRSGTACAEETAIGAHRAAQRVKSGAYLNASLQKSAESRRANRRGIR